MQLYKPNKSIKGSALSVSFVAKVDKEGLKGDKSFYFQLIQQTGWNDDTGNGTFKDGKKITVKFAPHEIAGIIAAIKSNQKLEDVMNVKYVYHDGQDSSSTIYFGPHFKKIQQGDKWVDSDIQVGFSLRVVKKSKKDENDKDQIAIGFTFAETELLSSYLQDGLTHIFNAWYAESMGVRTKSVKKDDKSKQEPAQEEQDCSW